MATSSRAEVELRERLSTLLADMHRTLQHLVSLPKDTADELK